jgi:hypothetical protein
MQQGENMLSKKLLSMGVAVALGMSCASTLAGPVIQNNAVDIVGAGASDPLIAVEVNRGAIIERLVAEHSDALATAGISEEAFRGALKGLRADQLLAARLVNTLAEITAIVSEFAPNGSALQRFVAMTPIEATSMAQLPSAEAFLVREGESLTIIKASRMQFGTPGVQLVGYFAPATTSVTVSSSTAAFTPKDGPGAGPNSWIGYTAGSNSASGSGSAVAAGKFNSASGANSFVGAGQSNSADGISSLVIGGFDNHATVIDATVVAGAGNRATGARSVVVGGGYNLASGQWSFIGGGGRQFGSGNAGESSQDHIAAGDFSAIGGGQGNRAGGVYSTVVGGAFNIASGARSIVLGGFNNTASGRDSIAAGCGANALNAGSIVISATAANPCGSDSYFDSVADNEFAVRATGGARFVTAVNGSGVPLSIVRINNDASVDAPNGFSSSNLTQAYSMTGGSKGMGAQPNTTYFRANVGNFFWYASGVHSNTSGDPGSGGTVLASLTPGASAVPVFGTFRAQTVTSTSDRNQKTAFEVLNPKNILAKVAAMPITLWSYKNEASSGVRHIGPVAQDFMRLFNVGYDDKSIATVDADGVALAAIQGLKQEVDEKNDRIDKLERELAAIKAKLGMN